MALLTDARSLELFAEALSKFVHNGTDKTVIEANRYKKSTLGLALTLAALISADVMLILFGNLSLSPEVAAERTGPAALPTPPEPVLLPAPDPSLVLMRQQFAAAAILQMEQSSYLTLVLAAVSSRKKIPDKPQPLVAAELTLLRLTSP